MRFVGVEDCLLRALLGGGGRARSPGEGGTITMAKFTEVCKKLTRGQEGTFTRDTEGSGH